MVVSSNPVGINGKANAKYGRNSEKSGRENPVWKTIKNRENNNIITLTMQNAAKAPIKPNPKKSNNETRIISRMVWETINIEYFFNWPNILNGSRHVRLSASRIRSAEAILMNKEADGSLNKTAAKGSENKNKTAPKNAPTNNVEKITVKIPFAVFCFTFSADKNLTIPKDKLSVAKGNKNPMVIKTWDQIP